MRIAARHASPGMGPRGDHSWAGALKLTLVGIALAVGLSFLLPITLGGNTLYVTTSGVSMEPGFHTGDLAVLRTADDYRVGDVAAYYSELNKTVVMHRIIEIRGDRHIFKGDNNNFIDDVAPTSTQLMGKLAFRLPKGGYAVHIITSGPALGIFAFLFIAGGGVAQTHRRRRDRRRAAMAASNSTSWIPGLNRLPRPRPGGIPARPPPRVSVADHLTPPEPGSGGGLSPFAAVPDLTGPRTRNVPAAVRAGGAVAAVVGCLALGLGAAAWTRPVTVTVQAATATPASSAADRQQSTLDLGYLARVRSSPAYDGTEITDPQPIFRKVLDRFEVSYVYQGGPGTLRADADLDGINGWTSTVPLDAGRRVTGRKDTGVVVLDLADFEARARAGAQAAGIAIGNVKVAVAMTVVRDDGTRFTATLDLIVSPTVVKPISEPQLDPVRDSQAATGGGVRTRPTIVANTVSLFGRSLTVVTARRVSLGAGLFSLVAGLLVAGAVRLSPVLTETQRIAQRYRELLVPIAPITSTAGFTVIDVPDIDSLARLASSYGLLLLHWAQEGGSVYVVQDEKTLYRYTLLMEGLGVPDSPEQVTSVPKMLDR